MKKLLANRLRERQETIEFRKIKSRLMVQAQNNVSCYYQVFITDKTIIMLQNEGLTVEKVIDGTEKYKVSW